MEEAKKTRKQQIFTYSRTIALIEEIHCETTKKAFYEAYGNSVTLKKLWKEMRERLDLPTSVTVEEVRLKYNNLLQKYKKEFKKSKVSGSTDRVWMYLEKFGENVPEKKLVFSYEEIGGDTSLTLQRYITCILAMVEN